MTVNDARLATRIPGQVSRRLRLLALVRGERLSATLTRLLDEALPSAEDLAGELGTKGSRADGN